MTALASPPEPAPGATGFDVATTSTDDLRAGVRVRGALDTVTCPLLLSVLRTHVRAGRRHVRVDLAGAVVGGAEVVLPLREVHEAVTADGGLLIFDGADDAARALLVEAGLFVNTVR